MLAAIRRASSLVSSLADDRRPDFGFWSGGTDRSNDRQTKNAAPAALLLLVVIIGTLALYLL
jgi:hypothetical protein